MTVFPWHDRFRMYSQEDQDDMLREIGTFLTTRKWHDCDVHLYWMGTFFGERFIRRKDGTTDRVRTFTTYEALAGWYPEFKRLKDLEQYGVDITFF
jgi:hypothetical protein